jgi:hypothetical protein
VQSTDRYLNPHFLKFKAGMLTTILWSNILTTVKT